MAKLSGGNKWNLGAARAWAAAPESKLLGKQEVKLARADLRAKPKGGRALAGVPSKS